MTVMGVPESGKETVFGARCPVGRGSAPKAREPRGSCVRARRRYEPRGTLVALGVIVARLMAVRSVTQT
jgi:hypothetical protein